VALLNGTAVGLISGLKYFSGVIQEVLDLQISEYYWQHMVWRVGKFEQQWVGDNQATRSPSAAQVDPDRFVGS
jgi:hypothetical protein